jgi:hypothetical protein
MSDALVAAADSIDNMNIAVSSDADFRALNAGSAATAWLDYGGASYPVTDQFDDAIRLTFFEWHLPG